MKNYYPYDPANPQAVTGEEHQIRSGQIRLLHIPQEGSIKIPGFTEASNAVALQSNEFYCSYRKDTVYREANRIVYFNKTLNGRTVVASYMAVGSPVTADDMNEIKNFMDTNVNAVKDLNAAQTEVKNDIATAVGEFRTSMVDHNKSADAHYAIRYMIAAENEDRLRAQADIRGEITRAKNEAITHANTKVNEHNTDLAAHADIRKAIDDAKAEHATLTEQFQKSLADHNADEDAHPYIQDLIDVEETARKLDVMDLSTKIDDEIKFRVNGISALDQKISDEFNFRIAGDSALDQKISDEFNFRIAGDSALDQKISDEFNFRIAGDSALDKKISDETDARNYADNLLDQAITTEVQYRIAADSALDKKIDDETALRKKADKDLDDKIAEESKLRAENYVTKIEFNAYVASGQSSTISAEMLDKFATKDELNVLTTDAGDVDGKIWFEMVDQKPVLKLFWGGETFSLLAPTTDEKNNTYVINIAGENRIDEFSSGDNISLTGTTMDNLRGVSCGEDLTLTFDSGSLILPNFNKDEAVTIDNTPYYFDADKFYIAGSSAATLCLTSGFSGNKCEAITDPRLDENGDVVINAAATSADMTLQGGRKNTTLVGSTGNTVFDILDDSTNTVVYTGGHDTIKNWTENSCTIRDQNNLLNAQNVTFDDFTDNMPQAVIVHGQSSVDNSLAIYNAVNKPLVIAPAQGDTPTTINTDYTPTKLSPNLTLGTPYGEDFVRIESGDYYRGAPYGTFYIDVSRLGDGEISVEALESNTISATINENTITISASFYYSSGKIRISVAETAKYKAEEIVIEVFTQGTHEPT